MDAASTADSHLSRLASAIAEPARSRMLCCLMDGHARTATELATVGGVAPSTASTLGFVTNVTSEVKLSFIVFAFALISYK